jgi:hypothetical protein
MVATHCEGSIGGEIELHDSCTGWAERRRFHFGSSNLLQSRHLQNFLRRIPEKIERLRGLLLNWSSKATAAKIAKVGGRLNRWFITGPIMLEGILDV